MRTLRDRVAQLFIVSFPGPHLTPALLSALEETPFGGVILYGPNCHSATQIQTLVTDLQSASRVPLLICTDQEGGGVVRIRHGAPVFPWEAAYGELGSATRVFDDAATTAVDLRALGLTMNLAPVVDVLSNPASPIGRRSYGRDPALVARLSVAAIRGYQDNGLAATAKHFVGLGHTKIDSHHALPTVDLDLAEFEAADFIPFRAAIQSGVACVLVAHVALPRIDPSRRPASLSPVIIQGVLRHRLGFQGLVMTDSLLMGAIPGQNPAEAAEQALAAGADMLLFGGNQGVPMGVIEEALDRVMAAIRTGRIPEARLGTALARVAAVKRRFPPSPGPPQ